MGALDTQTLVQHQPLAQQPQQIHALQQPLRSATMSGDGGVQYHGSAPDQDGVLGTPRYDDEYERQQVNAAATSGKAAPTKKVTASGGADDDQFADVELGDDLLP